MPSSCALFPCSRDLQPADLSQVADLCLIRTFEKQAQILDQQDETTDVFFILSGSVRISSYTEGGREVIFNEMTGGDIFGEFAAVDQLPRSAAVQALSECLVARMTSARFFEVLRRYPTSRSG